MTKNPKVIRFYSIFAFLNNKLQTKKGHLQNSLVHTKTIELFCVTQKIVNVLFL